MGMSAMYGKADEAECIATIHEAIDHGINLIDTGDFYGIGRNELLIGRALHGARRDKIRLSVKFGALRAPDHSWIGFDSRPAIVKNALAHTLARLGVDYIDIHRPSRLDPHVPIEDTVGAMAEMVKAGYVRAIGLSEVGVDTIKRAHAVHPISDLQIEYSLISRMPEESIFPALQELGIGVTAYGVLSRGLLSGSVPSGTNDFRSRLPRFTGDNFEQNRRVVDKLQAIARGKGITGTQLAIAWVLAKNPSVVALIGARTRAQLQESLGALAVQLSPEDIAMVEAAVPAAAIAGTRYDAHSMQTLDSER
jgi:aryl-alcohol dehydrogenase-like predicted oxidoreductase